MTTIAAPAPEAVAGYGRLRRGDAVAVLRQGAVVWVEGPDAAGFLQGLLSNDVAALGAGAACAALLLDAKGHVLVELRVHRDAADAYTLLVEPGAATLLAEQLDRYHFSEDLEILGPEPVAVVTLAGAVPRPRGVVVPGPLPGTVDVVTDDPGDVIAVAGAAEAPPEALEMARVAAGVPRVGVDTGPATLVQEVGLEATAVSFSKGCYLGQETVARLQFRGRANRRLRGLRLGGPPPGPGTPVLLDGREVGVLSSAAETPDLGPVGLAVVRREVGDGAAVEVGGAPARVVPLPFAGP